MNSGHECHQHKKNHTEMGIPALHGERTCKEEKNTMEPLVEDATHINNVSRALLQFLLKIQNS